MVRVELKIKKLKIATQKSDNHYDADMAMIRIQALEWATPNTGFDS